MVATVAPSLSSGSVPSKSIATGISNFLPAIISKKRLASAIPASSDVKFGPGK